MWLLKNNHIFVLDISLHSTFFTFKRPSCETRPFLLYLVAILKPNTNKRPVRFPVPFGAGFRFRFGIGRFRAILRTFAGWVV